MTAHTPLRLMFDATRLHGDRTGVEYYTSSLIEALSDIPDGNLELIGYYYGNKAPGSSAPHGEHIRYRKIWLPGKLINLLRRVGLAPPIDLLTLMRADFILYPNFLGLPSLRHTQNASVIHDLTFIDLPDYVARRNLRDLQKFIPKQLASASFIITVSNFTKQRIIEHYAVAAEKILVTPIPPPKPMPMQNDSKETLKTVGIDGKYILFIGTIEPRKNILAVLEAYTLLPEELKKSYRLVIVGKTGWNCEVELSRIKDLVEMGEPITQIGYVSEDIRTTLYQNASLYTSASFYEGFGMTVLESMSYGVPCVISDIPVHREVAGDEAALYFDQQNPQSITNAWMKVLADTKLQTKLKKAGYYTVSTYSWRQIAEKLHKQILSTLKHTD